MRPRSNNDHVRKTLLKNLHPVKAQGEIRAVLEFNPNGDLKNIFLNSQDDRDQFILQRGIERLIRPYHFGWVRRFFR